MKSKDSSGKSYKVLSPKELEKVRANREVPVPIKKTQKEILISDESSLSSEQVKKQKIKSKSTGTGSIISVENLSKSFVIPHLKRESVREHIFSFWRDNADEQFFALKNLSLDIKPGEFFGVIGRNGSGKSTLLKILAGIYVYDSGKVVVNGEISPFLELGIGFNPELSARDNVFINGLILGLSHKEVKQKFNKIIDFAELPDFVDTKVKHFSTGMYLRLSFSVAIQSNRDILLMDEVLAVGDANFHDKCYAYFEKLKAGRKHTMVFVSHDLGAIEKFCDRVLVLEHGKGVIIASPREAIAEYHKLLANKPGI